MELFWI